MTLGLWWRMFAVHQKHYKMAQLSKQVIEQIALKMTEKTKKHVEQLLKDYQQVVTDLYEITVADEVKTCFKKHPDYFDTVGTLSLRGHGFDYLSVSTTKRVISRGGAYSSHFDLTSAQADKITKPKRAYEKASEEYKKLFQETESALLTLKTHKNIKENLPEAEPFLPPPMSNALVVNFDSLHKKLKKQNELEKKVAV